MRPAARYYEANVGGARSVCHALQRAGVPRALFASSVAVYGVPAFAADEDRTPRPTSHYGRSKWAAEREFQGSRVNA